MKTTPGIVWGLMAMMLAADVNASPIGFNRVARRAAEQVGLANSNSWMERNHHFGSASNSFVSFDYFVDSETGDQLRVYVNALLAFSASGRNELGHARIPITSAGNKTIRIVYVKNGSVNQGMDMAWIDDLRLIDGGKQELIERFNHADDTSLSMLGWTVGGSAGVSGFRLGRHSEQPGRSVARPREQYGVHSSTTYLDLTHNFGAFSSPWNARIEFNYLVDSQLNGDFLRFRIDGVEQDLDPSVSGVQGISGRNRSGKARIRVTSGGSHTFRWEYVKNGSVTHGRDLVRLDDIVLFDKAAVAINGYTFSDRTLGSSPPSIGGVSDGFTAGNINVPGLSTTSGFAVVSATPTSHNVPLQTIGARWGGSSQFAVFDAEPVVDGQIKVNSFIVDGGFGTSTAEYDNATLARVEYPAEPTIQRQGRLSMVASSASNRLFLGFRLRGATTAAGNESGHVTLYFDAERAKSLNGTGSCGANVTMPGAGDYQLVFDYNIAAGGSVATISNVHHYSGSCGASWSLIDGTPAGWWIDPSTELAVKENTPGWISLELAVDLGVHASVLGDAQLGFAFSRVKLDGTTVDHFPNDDTALNPGNVLQWGTIHLDPSLPEAGRLANESRRRARMPRPELWQ